MFKFIKTILICMTLFAIMSSDALGYKPYYMTNISLQDGIAKRVRSTNYKGITNLTKYTETYWYGPYPTASNQYNFRYYSVSENQGSSYSYYDFADELPIWLINTSRTGTDWSDHEIAETEYNFVTKCNSNNIKKIKSISLSAEFHSGGVSADNKDNFRINGITPDFDSTRGRLTWTIPCSNTCGDKITVKPTYNGEYYAIYGYFKNITANPCPIIYNFSGSSEFIYPDKGESIRFSASAADMTWTLDIAGLTYQGTGVVNVTWNGKDTNGNIVPDGVYTATLSAETPDGICSDSKSVQVTAKSSCNLKIAELTGSSQIIRPDSGGSIQLSGSISDSSDKPVNWTLTVAGATYTGTGKTLSVTWDGKDAHGKVVEPGDYAATLTASTEDGKCSDTKTIWFQVRPADGEQCGLLVDFGSSAHLASGNLSHSQELFSSRGGVMPTDITLYYNSLDPHSASLGTSWSHSYDISLKRNSDGSLVFYSGNGKRRLYTHANGIYVSQPGDYSALVKNADGSFTLAHKDGVKFSFGANDRVATIIDRNDNTVTFGYTGGNLTSVTDPAGRVTALTYDTNNHLTSVTDPNGNSYAFSYSGNTLAAVINPDGGTWRYAYDAGAFMLSKTDPLGNTTTYAYDDKHRVTSATDPGDKVRSIAYPQGSDTTSTITFTEKDGGMWQYVYDTKTGTLTSKTDPQGGTTSYTYDAIGNRATETLPDGSTKAYTYDSQGNMTSTTDTLGQTTSYTFNSFGQVTSNTDPQGNTTGYGYDSKGNVAAITDPTGATTQYEYDVKGNVAKVTNPLGQSTTFAYDANSNLVSTTDPVGASTSFTYDAAGNVISQTDANGATTRFEYDAKSRLVKAIDPAGNVTTYTYDMGGNRTSQTDANGNVTRYEYNFKGQVTKVTDAFSNSTIYTYGGSACPSCGGGADKLTAITDAIGNTTRHEYDQLGRLTKETDPLDNITAYIYDAKGNLISKTDGNGNTIKYTYDGMGRLLRKSYPDRTEETFTYDAKGNILNAANQHIAYSFTYDVAGRLLSVIDSYGRSVQHGYDAAGRKIQTIYPEGSAVLYGYDKAGRLAIITDGDTLEAYSITYDNLGRRAGLSFPKGVTTSYGYDAAGRLTTLIHRTAAGATIASFDYTSDKVGNRLTKAEPDRKTSYAYDKIYRLLQALPTKLHGSDKEREHKAENYSYDPAGNRLSGPRARDYYSYIAGNRLIADRGHQNSYDRNGNLTEKSGKDDDGKSVRWSYDYDYENRLIKVIKREGDETTIVSFAYDPFSRRIEKRVEEVEHGKVDEAKTTNFVYDNEDIILEYVTKSEDEKMKTEATRYIHGPGIDEPLSIQRKGEVHYYHADGLGSIMALTDAKQKVVESYEYDSFGNMKRHEDKVKNRLTYTGREWDKETGLYYYRARYYDPIEGRFISKDPIGFAGGDVNLYAYVQNNPINFIDPTGLAATSFLGDGRSIYDGPKNGNWGGKNWSGGRNPQQYGGLDGPLPPTDSADICYMNHDHCYGFVDKQTCSNNNEHKKACDVELLNCLSKLSHNPTNWPLPPQPGTEDMSEAFRTDATVYFGLRTVK